VEVQARLPKPVEALGGSIKLHSPAGQGTRLQIDLPIRDRPSS
jgi:chemotaxis protein histidine kinase CheA